MSKSLRRARRFLRARPLGLEVDTPVGPHAPFPGRQVDGHLPPGGGVTVHVCARRGKAAQVRLGCTEGSGSPVATFQPCGPSPQRDWPEAAALVGEKRF